MLFPLLATSNATAQDFLPYPPEAAYFLTQWHGELSNNVDVHGEVELAGLGGTEMIKGMQWKRIHYAYRTVFWTFDSTYVNITPLTFHSYMRCDTNGVTWVHWSLSDTAMIWFDPGIQPGDTVPDSWFITQQVGPLVMYDIDTVTINGVERLLYYFPGPSWTPLTFVEGIGYPMFNYESGQGGPFDLDYFTCHDESDSAPVFTGCYSVTAGVEETVLGGRWIGILGNPVQNELRPAGLLPAGARYAILDPTGRTLLTGPVVNGSVDVTHLAVGTYLARFEEEDGSVLGSARFMKAASR